MVAGGASGAPTLEATWARRRAASAIVMRSAASGRSMDISSAVALPACIGGWILPLAAVCSNASWFGLSPYGQWPSIA